MFFYVVIINGLPLIEITNWPNPQVRVLVIHHISQYVLVKQVWRTNGNVTIKWIILIFSTTDYRHYFLVRNFISYYCFKGSRHYFHESFLHVTEVCKTIGNYRGTKLEFVQRETVYCYDYFRWSSVSECLNRNKLKREKKMSL